MKSVERWFWFFFIILFGCWSLIRLATYPEEHSRLRVRLISSVDAVAQVFWAGSGETYGQARSIVLPISPEKELYEVKLPPLREIKSLRVDPLDRPGQIILLELLLLENDRVVALFDSAEDFESLSILSSAKAITVEPLEQGVKLVSGGSDPQLIIDAQRPGRIYFVVTRLIQALLGAALMTFLLRFLLSPQYRQRAGALFPRSSATLVKWSVGCLVIGAFFVLVTPVSLPSVHWLPLFVCWSLVVGTSLFLSTLWLATRPVERDGTRDSLKYGWFLYALPCYVVWPLYLLAFWPAIMSPDSLGQWDQILNNLGNLEDWHPAFHTLLMWLVTRLWLSPTMVALVQIIGLGAVVGWTLTVFQRHGVPRRVLWAMSLLFAFWPVNSMFVITLWKDIAYAAAVSVLSVILLRVALTGGTWLRGTRALVWLGLAIFSVAIFRHNGVLPAAAVSCLLLFFYGKFRQRLVVSLLATWALFFLIRGPLYDYLDVIRGNPLSHVYEKLSKDFREMTSGGKRTPVKVAALDAPAVKTGKKKLSADEHLAERIGSSSLLWRIKPLQGYFRRIDRANLWVQKRRIRYIGSNDLGLRENSLLPSVKDEIFKEYRESTRTALFIIWQPAVYLYFFLISIGIAIYRTRKKNLLLVALPALLSSLPVIIVILHKSIFRYHYGLVVTALLCCVPLLYLDSPDVDPEN